MSDVDIHHLAAAYALDALEDHERAEFEAHYGSCDVCRTDVLDFRRTMADVAAAFPAPPPSAVKQRVLAEIATTRQLSPVVTPVASVVSLASRRKPVMWLAAAASLVLIVAGVLVVGLTRDRGTSYADELARVMGQEDTEVLHLAPMDGSEGMFKVAWSESLGEAVLIGEDLPAAPDGEAYELWWFPMPDADDAPPSPNEDGRLAMFVLDPADDGDVHQVIDLPARPAAWAITMEPEEGAPVTTGDVMFVAATSEA